MRRTYQYGLDAHELSILKRLRGKGFAVSVIPPDKVGNPLNRHPLEQAMQKAAKNYTKQLQEQEWIA
jgi:hypothetical protein